MRFNPKARIDPGRIDVRGPSGGGGFGRGGGGMRLPIPTGGRFGWGTVVIIILYVVIQMCSGASLPGPNMGAGSESPGNGAPQQPSGNETCATGADANDDPYGCGVFFFEESIENYWNQVFQEQAGRQYQDTETVLFQGRTESGCGAASSAMGPFYCPNDGRVYIDRNFMDQMLQGQLGAEGGPFALAYVVAHEYGHHVENLLGVLGKARTGAGPESDGVKIELMADCLAGMWAKAASTQQDDHGNVIIEDLTQDDINRALDAAQKVGDDYIQQRSGGRVSPESWTHGSSEQRMKWFNIGLQEGSLQACDTWSAGAL